MPTLRPGQQAQFGWGRVDAFIDAIYAIAATLLVLELRPPHAEEGQLGQALLDQWPTYLVYALGFVQIVGGWGVLRRVSAWSIGIDHYGMLLVMGAVLTFSLQPFVFGVMVEAIHDRDDFTAAVRLLAVVLLISMVCFCSMMVYLRRRGFFRPDLDPELFEVAYRMASTAVVWPILTLALTWVIGPWALTGLVVFFVITMIPVEALTGSHEDEAIVPAS
jgi:uncharacterized membrane protein